MMQSANPSQWHQLVAAYRLVQANENLIGQCRKRAGKKGEGVRCTVTVEQE